MFGLERCGEKGEKGLEVRLTPLLALSSILSTSPLASLASILPTGLGLTQVQKLLHWALLYALRGVRFPAGASSIWAFFWKKAGVALRMKFLMARL